MGQEMLEMVSPIPGPTRGEDLGEGGAEIANQSHFLGAVVGPNGEKNPAASPLPPLPT